ncbi:NAD(P)-dependent oxidoreductase [Peterkaempfera sp. SMS 1(5)a]|uniref:NAD(P)-dependent oxidoreductase n=1 Tax=Peterkaempfera podocarpi TaxID=3232308 RepID=UPI00366EA8FB
MTTLRVLLHPGLLDSTELPPDLAGRVELVEIPGEGPLPDGLTAEALFTYNAGAANLADALSRDVRWVHLYGTGLDRADLPTLTAGGRTVTNSSGAGAVPISEWVLAVMLAEAKQLPESWGEPGDGRAWGGPYGLRGLHGKRLGLIGLGGIGQAVAVRALAFGMEVRALRRTGGPSPVPGVEVVGSLEQVLDGADHVVVTAPLTPATRGLLDARAFGAMKPGVHLVNIARGAIVDQEALRAALDDGTVARASLDVVHPEPLPSGHWLWSHPSVRLSAHVSWEWEQARTTAAEIFFANLRRRLAGEPLRHVIDGAEGY